MTTNEEILKELKALRDQVEELADPEPVFCSNPYTSGGYDWLHYALAHADWSRRRNKRRGITS